MLAAWECDPIRQCRSASALLIAFAAVAQEAHQQDDDREDRDEKH
jgi:hypothetical protein